MVTEGDTLREALQCANDALAAIIEAYEDLKRPLPPALQKTSPDAPIWLETAVVVQ